MATFVLIAGAWHGSWCWQRVIPLLAAQGHRVIAPDLAGMGADTTPLDTVNVDLWAAQVADIVAAQPEPAILVGHSRGGIVISAVAERIPDRIATLVYLAAFLLGDGGSILAAAVGSTSDLRPEILRIEEDGRSTIASDQLAPVFYQRTDPHWQRAAMESVGPEPAGTLTAPIAVSDTRFGRVPRAYIECTDDRAVPIALQRAMQATWPCDPVVTLDSDHSPFFSDPQALTDALIAIAGRPDAAR